MTSGNLPYGPLYDPKCKVRSFKFQEDFENIRLNLLGTGVLYEDSNFYHYLKEEWEWKRPKEICNRPFFIKGQPKRFDALQGLMGDCYLLNAMQAITLNEPLIKHVVPPDQSFYQNYIGAFHFRIWKFGTWYDVVVDDRLPVIKRKNVPCFAHSMSGDVFWACLLEKAYAKFYGGYSVSYDNLKGGFAFTAFQDLSGGLIENIKIANPLPTTTIQSMAEKAFSNKALMSCIPLKKEQGLLDYHGYTVTKLIHWHEKDPNHPGLFLIRLMNPWGNTEWQGWWSDDDDDHWRQIDRNVRDRLGVTRRNDGEFWMSMEDFVKYFVILSVCHLGPGQYVETRNSYVPKTWRSTVFFGEWVKNVSAGGSSLATRHKNPQYFIRTDFPENDANRNGYSTVVIELTQRSIYGRHDTPEIAFYVYSLKNLENLPTPLDQPFFANHKPLDEHPNFSSSEGRAFLSSMELDCRVSASTKYCIVPCTRVANKETQFMLRVFTESRFELWEYDTPIGKMLLPEKSVKEFDQGLKLQFYEVSQGQDEIDWIGLQFLLNKRMRQTTFGFGMMANIFSFVWEFLGRFILISTYPENSGRRFTKDECRSMIAMSDTNHSGKLTFNEVNGLWEKIWFWTEVYEQHRDEVTGCLRISQLREALSSIGFDTNKRTINKLSYVYANEEGNVSLTDFIMCGVSLETVLSVFQEKYQHSGNEITFTLEEWIERTLIL